MVEEQWVQWNVLFPLWFILMSLVDWLYCIYILFSTLFFMLKLYFSCRHNNKPYLLIDFSNYLRTDVWVCFSFVTGVWHWLYSPHILVHLISMYPCFFFFCVSECCFVPVHEFVVQLCARSSFLAALSSVKAWRAPNCSRRYHAGTQDF